MIAGQKLIVEFFFKISRFLKNDPYILFSNCILLIFHLRNLNKMKSQNGHEFDELSFKTLNY